MEKLISGIAEHSVAQYTLPGEVVSGDGHLLVPTGQGVLIAAIDGLGHGPEAFAAARLAGDVLQENAGSAPLESIIERCHSALRSTRGAAISVVEIDTQAGTLKSLCIGDVQGCLLPDKPHVFDLSPQYFLLLPGLVGRELPPLTTLKSRVYPGDILLLATDGIYADYPEHVVAWGQIDEIVNRIMDERCKKTDDALVLAVRYLGA